MFGPLKICVNDGDMDAMFMTLVVVSCSRICMCWTRMVFIASFTCLHCLWYALHCCCISHTAVIYATLLLYTPHCRGMPCTAVVYPTLP